MADAIINSMVKDLVSSTNSTMENGMKLSPYDRTYTAKVSGGNLQGGYDVSFNGVTYTGIKTLGGSCVANEIVKLIIPQNNYSQMFILKFAEADNTDETVLPYMSATLNTNGWFRILSVQNAYTTGCNITFGTHLEGSGAGGEFYNVSISSTTNNVQVNLLNSNLGTDLSSTTSATQVIPKLRYVKATTYSANTYVYIDIYYAGTQDRTVYVYGNNNVGNVLWQEVNFTSQSDTVETGYSSVNLDLLSNGMLVSNNLIVGSVKSLIQSSSNAPMFSVGTNNTIGSILDVCEGTSNVNNSYCSHAEGNGNDISGDYNHAEGNGNTMQSSYSSHAEGSSNTVAGNSSHAEGSSNTATGNYSHAEGYNSVASSDASHAEGWYTKSKNVYAHSEGQSTTASGSTAHSEGYFTTASGNGSHTEGDFTTASGSGSHTEGDYTTASGNGSHAEGDYTTASENDSHAEGVYTTASGSGSHAEGFNTTASGIGSHAEGFYTVATENYQHVEGLYNIVDTSGNLIHIIGNGSYGSRSNAFTVDVNGKIACSTLSVFGLNTAPASATDTGTLGEIRITSGYVYVCVGTNTWVRSALTTW